ncbi:MAG: glycosyltransferase family 39 protein [Acidimicrobiales bacterium]|nr:glycosyltransferase family 39 protein [Acidimicrobiales bacterium]
MPTPDAHEADLDDELPGGRHRTLALVVLGLALAVGVVLRFTTRSALWLDEALSVNISRLPLGEIPDALRHDGHPPLYYVLLHGWMAVFGEGDGAVRALSGLCALAVLPLLWIAGKRLGGPRVAWCALAVVALSPYAIRYGTETRMYALMMVLGLAGWLLYDDALRAPTWPRLAGLALVSAAALWTHYWAMWLLAVVAGALVVQIAMAHRRGEGEAVGVRVRILGALVAGGVLFLPWAPALLYQSAHTGTPWARPVRPTEMLTGTIADLGGGARPESVLLGWVVALLALLGIFGRRLPGGRVELAPVIRRPARPFVVAVGATLALACLVGYATGATYATRYAAVVVPFVVLLAALGLSLLPRAVAGCFLALLFGLGALGGYRNVTVERTDARQSAAAIEAVGQPGDLVVYCPDQLGPSTNRVLAPGFDEVTYPAFDDPERVDWVDYQARLDAADPVEFAVEALERAGDRDVFLVYSTSYVTHEDICPELFNALGAVRPPEVLTETTEAWEPSAAVRFPAPTR